MSNEPQSTVRSRQLQRLGEKLSRIADLLETHSEEGRIEARMYRSFQDVCEKLLHDGFVQDDLNELSATIMREMDSKKSRGYYPVSYDKNAGQYERLPKAQIQAFEEAIKGLYDLALSLRVVGVLK